MRIIHDWKAKRSSATMTIEGVDLDGAPVKVAGIVTIEAGTVWPVATDLWTARNTSCARASIARPRAQRTRPTSARRWSPEL